MTAGLDIVTNDAGDRVRRAHARDMGEDVIVALHRLVRLTRLHDVENEAFTRQLEQTHKLVVEYCLHAGTHLSVLFANKVILVGGQILKGSRSAYDAAMDLGEILSWCGGAELAIARDITINELRDFADALAAAQRNRRTEEFQSPTRKIRLRAVSAAAKLRGVDIEYLNLEQRIVRTYASAVVVMRRFFEDLRSGQYVLPPKIKRIAQNLVDLSEGRTPAFLGVTEVRNQNHDDAGRAVNTAILAVAAARQVTTHRTTLSQIAMAALMHDVSRPRAIAEFATGLPGVVPRLSEDSEDRLPAGAAAVLTALGRVNEPTVARTVVTFEALWLRRGTSLGPLYGGIREPTLHARIITIARKYNDLVTPEPGLPPPPPERAIAQLAKEFRHPADKTILRMLVAALGLFPMGTLVRLTTGETAEVIQGPESGSGGRPWVRLIMDARGGMITPPRDVSLAAPELRGADIAQVLSTDGWGAGLEMGDVAAPVADSSIPPPPAQQDSDYELEELGPAQDFQPEPGSFPPSESGSLEDSLGSAVSNSLDRSLGWNDPPPPVQRAPKMDPLRQTVPAVPLVRQAAPMGRPQPELELDLPDEEDGTERTVFEPSPFALEDRADISEAPDDDEDEAGTIFYQRASSPPALVGAQLREQAGIPPTAQGDLGKTPLVHVLVYVLDRELSGSLVLLDPEGREHCVFFDRGAPAKCRTEHPVAMLGEELIAARMLPPSALEAMLRAAQEHGALLGEYLTRNRLITRAALDQALRAQVIHRLEWMAKLPGDTQYEFYRDQNLLTSWGGEMTPCEPLGAILCAMRSWNDHERIISNLMRLKDNPIQLHPKANLQGIALSPEEDGVLATIKAKRLTLLELYGNSLSVDRGISAFLYMLFATRQLQIPGQDRGPMRSSLQGKPVVPLSESQQLRAVGHLEPTMNRGGNLQDDDAEELSYESYPSLATSPSAVAQAVVSDMQAAISYRSEAPDSVIPQADDQPSIPEGLEPTARGKLSGTPLIHVLTYMLDHQATGSVVLREPEGAAHIVYFENGAAAKVRTGRPVAQLCEMLVAEGELDPMRVDAAVATAKDIDALIGEYLIVDSLASRGAVIGALERQVTAKLIALANIQEESRYAYYRGTNLLASWAGDDLFPAHPLSMILAIARAWSDRRRIRGALHKILDQELRLHPECDLARLATTDPEVEVLNGLVGGGYTLRSLHRQRLAREEEVNSLVYALAITRQFLFRKSQKPPMRFFGARRSQLDPPVSSRPSRPPAARQSDPPSSSGMRISFVPASKVGPPESSVPRQPPSERSPFPEFVPDSQPPSSAPSYRPSPPPTAPPASFRPSPSSPPSAIRRSAPATSTPVSVGPTHEERQRAMQDFHAATDAMKRGDRAKAERLARQAVEYAPDVDEHAALLAWVRASSPREDATTEGIAALTNVLRRNPDCELALLYRAKLLRRAGRPEPALSDLDHVLELNPDNREAQGEARLLRAKQRHS